MTTRSSSRLSPRGVSRRSRSIAPDGLRGNIRLLGGLLLSLGMITVAFGEDPIPRGQSQPPGPPLSPEQAIAKMVVPEGFEVELVASEPQIVNPIGMTFDEQGRIWVTESFEYPRSSAGPGRDRIKMLEDTDGDGRVDKTTIFAEGLNIPSGIAVGYGGVWVANAPDILFLQDTDGDGRADHEEVVVTGFGRTDTHELPNSLTWGPDGYLYGLNGVFNHSHVKQGDREYRFTCAVFRIDPRTRKFELFAEGTSNPWGIAWNPEGHAFLSACVIDHLWHITESGYYHRQGGPYPPFTWKIESIVDHKHQQAAYCGIHYLDSEAYPPQYRDRLYMGNIHGNCINVDQVEPRGSTYHGKPNDDFLTANDAWFMPVVQKIGPDGCLYILDWYDRYHCYQDARRDPEGIDRDRGRLYRVRYQQTPRAAPFDLQAESNKQLVARLLSTNVFYRDLAQRVLAERMDAELSKELEAFVLEESHPRKSRLHALWTLISGRQLDPSFIAKVLDHEDPGMRSWGVRAAGDYLAGNQELEEKVAALAEDDSPVVQLQVAIAADKLKTVDPIGLYVAVLANCGDDPLIPQIVWQNLHPKLKSESAKFLAEAKRYGIQENPNLAKIMPRVTERILAQ